MRVQGKALVKMIALVKNNADTLVVSLQGLARGHAYKGVLSNQYAIVGEVLLWTLAKVLGKAGFDAATTRAWIKIYSLMLSVIIPVAIVEERLHRVEFDKLLKEEASAENCQKKKLQLQLLLQLKPLRLHEW